MPSHTDELIRIYQDAQKRLITEITSAQARGATGTAAYKRAILANVNQILAELQGQSAVWVAQNIPAEYRAGLEAANKSADAQYKAAGEIPPVYPSEFASVHQEALRVLIDDTNRTFTELISYTGRNIDDMIAEANREAIAAKLASGSTVDQAAAILSEMLTQRGITAFEYKRNGQTVYMQLDRYAAMVARSTTAEVQNQASLLQAQEIAGDLVKMTTHSPTCPICYPLQGRVYSISGKTKGYPKLQVAYSGGYANIHPNCVVGDTVVSSPPIISHFARRYEGEVIIIRASSGKELTITPNHPVLTNDGWVDAGLLNKSHKVIEYIGREGVSLFSDPNNIQIPTAIKDIPASFWKPSEMSAACVPVSAEDFHGDIGNSEICVISSDSSLLTKDYIFSTKPLGKSIFKARDMKPSFFSSFSRFFFFVKRFFSSSYSIVSSFGKLLSPFSGHSTKPSFHRVASVFWQDAATFEGAVDSHLRGWVTVGNFFLSHTRFIKVYDFFNRKFNFVFSGERADSLANFGKFNPLLVSMFFESAHADAENGSNLINALSGHIKVSDVIEVKRINFSGHVYNLHTVGEWYVANGIITHNCRHRVNPYVPALKSTEQIAADREYSNRPLTVDEMSRAEQAIYQEQLDRYNTAQKAKATLRNNRDQYQRYLSRLGSDEAPKSFSGFMRMKKADGESWQNLQAQYRALGVANNG